MRRLASSLFSLGLLAACGSEVSSPAGTSNQSSAPGRETTVTTPSDGAGGSATQQFCSSDAPASTCAAARHVATADDLAAEIGKLPWQGVSISHTGALSIGDDLVADADISMDASAIPGKQADATMQLGAPLFRDYAFPKWSGPGVVEGVSCAELGPHPVRKGDTCAKITIAKGATFRLRAVVEDMHPSAPTYWPFVEFERACSVSCGADETRCGASQTCFTKGFAACAYCEGQAMEVCACRKECSTLADGEACYVDKSPDQEESGSCRRGTCVTP